MFTALLTPLNTCVDDKPCMWTPNTMIGIVVGIIWLGIIVYVAVSVIRDRRQKRRRRGA